MEDTISLPKQIMSSALTEVLDNAKVPMRYHLKIIEALTKRIQEHEKDTEAARADRADHRSMLIAHEKQLQHHDQQLTKWEETSKHLITLQKGEPGERGADGISPVKGIDYFDGEAGEKGNKGDKGDDAIIDLDRIVNAVLDAMKGKEKKLSITDLDGLDAFTQRLQASLKRDGFMFNGKKVKFEELMNGSGGTKAGAGLVYLPLASGIIDNNNTVFTFSRTPTIVVVNGASYVNGAGVTINGDISTLDNPAGKGGSVYGLG